MYAHLVPRFFLLQWHNDNGAESLFFFDKEKNQYLSNVKNAGNVFGKGSFYYLKLFSDKDNNEDDASFSGRHKYLVDYLYKAFPFFFAEIDENIFGSLKLFVDEKEIIENKAYTFVYFYFSSKKIEVKDFSDKTVSNSRLKHKIEEEWISKKHREANESFLASLENKYKAIHDHLLTALDMNDRAFLKSNHDDVAKLCALQQSRLPNDEIVKRSIDHASSIATSIINEISTKHGITFPPIVYNNQDYKAICLIQLLEFFNRKTLLLDKEESETTIKFNSLYEALLDSHKKSNYFYLKATDSHKFIIGNNPMVIVPYKNNKGFVALPISPNYCILICTPDNGIVIDTIIQGTNNLIDYINQQELTCSEKGVVSYDKKFVNKTRTLDISALTNLFRKNGFAI